MRWENLFIRFSLLACLTTLYLFMGYGIAREQSIILVLNFSALFMLSFWLIRLVPSKHTLWIGIVFRLLFIVAIPWLSQDFYRFLWDGFLLKNGHNPYAITPDALINQTSDVLFPLAEILYQNMGELSASHYSNYPPLNQMGFLFSVTWFSNHLLGAVVLMRFILIFADIGIYYFGKQLLEQEGFDRKRLNWYFLNPLVIIELTGNLHWEGAMLFFFIVGWWLYREKKAQLSACFFAMSVATKLIPLILLPVIIRFQSFRKNLMMGALGSIILLLFFLPFFYGIGFENYLRTLQLWFKNFEFNGSIYYIIRWIGYQIKGYNIIRQLGEVTPWIIVMIVFYFSFWKRKKSLHEVFTAMLYVLSIYYFSASIVHPWYIIPLILLSLFTQYSYPLIWSALIPLSYVTYGHPKFEENLWIIGLAYGLVYAAVGFETIRKRPLLQHF